MHVKSSWRREEGLRGKWEAYCCTVSARFAAGLLRGLLSVYNTVHAHEVVSV